MAVPSQAGPGLAVGLALAPSHPPALRGGPWGGSGVPLSLEGKREARQAFSCRPGSGGRLLLGLLRRWECGLDGKINFPLEFSFLLTRKESWRGEFFGPSRYPAHLFVRARSPEHGLPTSGSGALHGSCPAARGERGWERGSLLDVRACGQKVCDQLRANCLSSLAVASFS